MTLPRPGRIYPDLETRREIEAKARREAYEKAAKVVEELARDADLVDCELDGERVAAAIRRLAEGG